MESKELLKQLKDKNVYLYGAGNFGHWAYHVLKEHINIKGFLDKYPKTSNVINPFESDLDFFNSIVIVTIFNRDVDYVEIKKELDVLGFFSVFSFCDLYRYKELNIPNWFWLSSDLSYLDSDKINVMDSLLKDTKSKQIFQDVIRARTSFDITLLPKTDPIDEQYFSEDLPLKPYDTFIDCGAFDGDTLEYMHQKNIVCDTYYGFEPDPQNYLSLVSKMRKYNQQGVVLPCGVYSSSEIFHFCAESSEGSAISENGEMSIQCISLDEMFNNILSPETYLKMDIEGAEYEAVKGAINTIQHISNSAICLYHRPEDLIRIPLLLNENGEFDYYLRQYGYYGMELVLFVVSR